MPPTKKIKWTIRSIFGGLLSLSLRDVFLSHSLYGSCTHGVINVFHITLILWWLKIEKYNTKILPAIAALAEVIFLFQMLDKKKDEGCEDSFESFLPHLYYIVIVITFWLDIVLLIVKRQALFVFLLFLVIEGIMRINNSKTTTQSGLSDSQKKELYSNSYTKEAHEENEDCPVCLLQMKEGEQMLKLPKCQHKFHVKCIDNWISSNITCPCCRQVIITE